jgi:hypothetical protein
MENFKLSLPASLHFYGDIIVTDPCYFIPDDMWQELCKRWFEGDATDYANGGVIELESGGKILYSNTAYGDGEYPVYAGKFKSVHNDHTGVDAGMIGVITVEDVQKLNPEFNVNDKWYPRINGFSGTIEADGHGNFIGDLEVSTSSEKQEEYYEENEEEMEEDNDDNLFNEFEEDEE